MPEPGRGRHPALLERALSRWEESLEPFLSDALGAETRIDLVARDGQGGAVVVLMAEAGRDLERLAEALAQAAWLAPRLGDWARLAPELRLRPERGATALLVARDFDERTRLAARALGPARIRLARLEGSDETPTLRLVDAAPSGSLAPRGPAKTPLRSVFRTGLRDEDLSSSSR
jgi:hypothetical protein